MTKPLTCGVLITDGNVLLLGHSTGNKHWDIPKGTMDEGETIIETALRELKEETDITLTADQVVDLGRYDYTPRKDLYVFLHRTDDLPPIEDVVCTSVFESKSGMLPELDEFKYVKLKKIEKYTTKNMNRTLTGLLDRLK